MNKKKRVCQNKKEVFYTINDVNMAVVKKNSLPSQKTVLVGKHYLLSH